MPMYNYVCEKCSKIFEVIVPLDKSEKEIYCKYCNSVLKKQLTPVYFKVK